MAESAWEPKLRRARHHERELDAALRWYVQLDPFEIVSKLEGNDLVVRVRVRHEIPEDLSLIAGDLLHNARSALDLLVTSAAWDFASSSGSQLTPADERKLFFPVTRTEPDFDRDANKIKPYLPGGIMARIRAAQPWSVVAARLAQEPAAVTADELDLRTWLDPLWRLHRLDILDKHREVLALFLQRAAITLGDDLPGPLDDDSEPEGELITSFDGLDPEERENLFETCRRLQEWDERPDSYDFYFSGGLLTDGAEIGRYMRHDRGQMPAGLTARGNLRLVLWEPELMRRLQGAPPLQKTVREMIGEVEWTCRFVESGVAGDGAAAAELAGARGGAAHDLARQLLRRRRRVRRAGGGAQHDVLLRVPFAQVPESVRRAGPPEQRAPDAGFPRACFPGRRSPGAPA